MALARCGELPPGFVDVFRPEVRKCVQDRVGFVSMLQVPLYRCDPDPGAGEHRSAGVHTAALLYTACVLGGTPGRLMDTQPERIESDHFLEDDLIRLQVAFPYAVGMLKIDLAADGREPELPSLPSCREAPAPQ